MKKLSLKLKITIWFTFILTLICIAILTAVATMYQASEGKNRRNQLTAAVHEQVLRIEGGSIIFWNIDKANSTTTEFEELENYFRDEVQLMVYYPDGTHAGGIFLYDEFDKVPYNQSESPQIKFVGRKAFYYYDEPVNTFYGKGIWVRGIITAPIGVFSLLSRYPLLYLIIILLLALASVGAYFLTDRFLAPIRNITKTASEISVSEDLSKRIDIPSTDDEISKLILSFNEMFGRLENNILAETSFTKNASHELRTPVSVILAHCEYAVDNLDNNKELIDAILAIQRQGYKMSSLIETLLTFTRIEQGTDRYPRENIDIVPLIKSVCDDFRIIEDKNIQMDEKLPENLIAPVNIELFNLLLTNLMQNAIRYGRENGFVKITLENTDSGYRLAFCDNGIGISENDLPHIFQQFYRADSSRSTKGMGLGLSLVERITKFHDGTIKVESTLGQGSIFTFDFPIPNDIIHL